MHIFPDLVKAWRLNSLLVFLSLLPFFSSAQDIPAEFHYSEDGLILQRGDLSAGGFYDPSIIRDVHIDFPQANYWSLLTNNYQSETDIPASVTIDGITYDSVGVRFRGNTSYSMTGASQKKSFALTSDFIHPDQEIMEYKNLKFNNAHQDATFMREVLYCQLAKKYTPIAKANYIHLFLNNVDWGVYPNVQNVDKTFLKEWFLSNDGARFRATKEGSGPGGGGGPGWGDGTAGLNNLGSDTTTYQKYYTLKSSEVENPWQKLIEACQVLSTATESNKSEVAQKLDIDKILWFLAAENIFADDDSYIMKGKMDYYVYYEPESGLVFPYEYDGNSAFQSEAATSWSPFYNVNKVNYPLLNKLLNIQEWRQRYLAHYRTILNETFTTTNVNALIDDMDSKIKAFVAADTKKLYTTAQYTSGVSALKTFVNNRRNYLVGNTEVAQAAPVISDTYFSNSTLEKNIAPTANQVAYVSSTIASSNGITRVNLYYDNDLVGNFQLTSMYDDGAHHDGQSGDGVYGGEIPGFPSGTLVRFYIEAIAGNAALSVSYFPEGAEHDVFVYTVSNALSPNGVVINEVLASNSGGATDENGDHDDWVELFNTNDFEVDLSGFYLSDDQNDLAKWEIPAGTIIPENGYLIIWADDETDQGPLHANWKISAGGETILLSTPVQEIVDSVTFGQQITDMGYARVPNGTGPFVIQDATFNATNSVIHISNGVVINEVLASNLAGQTDEAGEYEDWVELYNNNETDINLSGFHLSDDGGLLDKWTFPAGTVIAAHGYMIIWADNEAGDGTLHASWKLNNEGESVLLSNPDLEVIDQAVFGYIGTDTAFARVPNGTGAFIAQAPTFAENNENISATGDIGDLDFMVYPNPVEDVLYIRNTSAQRGELYILTDITGRKLMEGILQNENVIDVSGLVPGPYFVVVNAAHPIALRLLKL